LDKRSPGFRRIFKLRVGTADVPDMLLRRYMLLLFFVSSALFLWTPTRWMVDTLQKYSAFQNAGWSLEHPSSAAEPARRLLVPAENENSDRPAKKPRTVVFRLLAPAAKKVFLGGSFNDFDARRHPLTRRPDGLWEISLDLPPGRYVYKFKVDGRWELDPTNPERSPEPRTSSILEIQ
jgi:hypothetical protein